MSSSLIRPRLLAAGIAACLVATTATQAGPVATGSVRAASADSVANAAGKTYIVMFSKPSVALRNRALKSGEAKSLETTGTITTGIIPFSTKPNGRAHMDMRSDVARSYRAAANYFEAAERLGLRAAWLRPLRIYALCLAGEVEAARPLMPKVEEVDQDSQRFWNWMTVRFGLTQRSF